MINLCGWHSIQTFETLIANSWEVHICSFFSDFYPLEPIYENKKNKKKIKMYLLSIMEIIAVSNILDFCWINFFFQGSKIIFVEFSLSFCCESLFNWVIETFLIVSIDSVCSNFGISLSIQILARNLRNIPSISWNMLSLKFISRSTNPSLAS